MELTYILYTLCMILSTTSRRFAAQFCIKMHNGSCKMQLPLYCLYFGHGKIERRGCDLDGEVLGVDYLAVER